MGYKINLWIHDIEQFECLSKNVLEGGGVICLLWAKVLNFTGFSRWNLHCKVGAVQCRINCSCQVEKLDIATSLLLLYQYFATVPVLVFCFNSVKSNLCQLHILILLSWDWLDTFGEKQEGDCSSIVGSAVPPANLLTWYRSRVEFSSRPVFALSFSFPTLGLEVALSYNSCCDRYELALPLIPTHKLLTWRTHLQQVRLMFLPAGPTTEQGQQEKGRNLRSTLLSND